MRSCRRTTEQRYLDGTWPDERTPNYGGERSGVRTQEDSIRRRGNYVGVITGRHDDSPDHQTPSGRGGRAPDAVTTQQQGTRRCQDAQGEEVCARVVSGFRVETKANQGPMLDRRGIIRDSPAMRQVRQTHRTHRMQASFFADAYLILRTSQAHT